MEIIRPEMAETPKIPIFHWGGGREGGGEGGERD